ncbi:MAG: tetratricopeptide repeat protein [Pseudanabaena sp. SU_2_4]|nr:tetratricopeptide repeat protein [Pseudanabaena sp. SU_2_4]
MDFPEGWFNQGRMLSALQRYNEALAVYDKALAIKPDYADAKVSRAEVAQTIGGNRLNAEVARLLIVLIVLVVVVVQG